MEIILGLGALFIIAAGIWESQKEYKWKCNSIPDFAIVQNSCTKVSGV